MTRVIGLFALVAVALVACLPGASGRPPGPEVVYNGSQEDVYATVVNIISTDQGIPQYGQHGASGAWVINRSDQEGGFIFATALSKGGYNFFVGQIPDHTHRLSVTITAISENRSQVVVQVDTDQAAYMQDLIYNVLDQEYGRVD